jgi:hypothetical protein
MIMMYDDNGDDQFGCDEVHYEKSKVNKTT